MPAPDTCGPLWLPPVEIVASSSSFYGYYPRDDDNSRFSLLYPSPRASSATVSAYMLPTGGLVSQTGTGGLGELPRASYSQGSRPAETHAVLVQTPDVHPNLPMLAVLVQRYDEHGFSDVSSGTMTITATLAGAPSSLTLTLYNTRGAGGSRWTRRHYVSVPSSWFDTADPTGSTATLISTLANRDSHVVTFQVYGTPTWFDARPAAAGIAAYMTSDASGTTPAETMRSGDRSEEHTSELQSP